MLYFHDTTDIQKVCHVELRKPTTFYTPVRPDIAERIQVGAEVLADISDADHAAYYLGELTESLNTVNLIGENVQLNSTELVWGLYDFEGLHVPVTTPSLLRKNYVRGIFMGLDQLEVDGQRVLIYKVQAEQAESDELIDYQVSAATERSSLNVQMEIPSSSVVDKKISEQLHLLTDVQDPLFKEKIRVLLDVFASSELDASILRDIGVLTTEMMGHEEVRNEPARVNAIIAVLDQFLNREDFFKIKGDEFCIETSPGKVSVYIQPIKAKAGIKQVVAVNYYELNNGVMSYEETLSQPAILINESNGKRHLVPLSSLKTFELIDSSCESSNARFLKFMERHSKELERVVARPKDQA